MESVKLRGNKMSEVAVGKEASQQTGSEMYFRTYQDLLRQKEKIDREILKMQGKFLKAVSKQRGVIPSNRVKYVPRLKNTTTLAEAIRECMIPNEEMIMDDILKALTKKGLYNTNSKYFYTMVNNKLNRDSQIKKVSRGVFKYRPRKKGVVISS
jgi:hypothetical protein